MARVYNKNRANKPHGCEVTGTEACALLSRSRRWLALKKDEGMIAPVAKYGNQHIYNRNDILALKERLTTRF